MHHQKLLEGLSDQQLHVLVRHDPLRAFQPEIGVYVSNFLDAGISPSQVEKLILSSGRQAAVFGKSRVVYACFDWYDAQKGTRYAVQFASRIGDVEKLDGVYRKSLRREDCDRAGFALAREYRRHGNSEKPSQAIRFFRRGTYKEKGFNSVLSAAMERCNVQIVKRCEKLLNRQLTDSERKRLANNLARELWGHEINAQMRWFAEFADLKTRSRAFARWCNNGHNSLEDLDRISKRLGIDFTVEFYEIIWKSESFMYNYLSIVERVLQIDPSNVRWQKRLHDVLLTMRERAIENRNIITAEEHGKRINQSLTVEELESFLRLTGLIGTKACEDAGNAIEWAKNLLVARLRDPNAPAPDIL